MKRIHTLEVSLLILAVVVQSAFGGWRDKKIEGSGNVVTESRDVSGIEAVNLATVGTLIITVGSEEKLEIEAEDNLIEYIQTDVDGGQLVIELESPYSFDINEPILYHLTVKSLEEIEASSAGDIEAPALKAGRMFVRISSAGNIDIEKIEADMLDIQISSAGDLNIDDVVAKEVEVDINSSGDTRIRALISDYLDVNINSSGNFSVLGGKVKEQEIQISSSGDYKGKRLESETASVTSGSSGDAEVFVTGYLKARLGSSGDVLYAGDPEVDKRTGSSGRVRRTK